MIFIFFCSHIAHCSFQSSQTFQLLLSTVETVSRSNLFIMKVRQVGKKKKKMKNEKYLKPVVSFSKYGWISLILMIIASPEYYGIFKHIWLNCTFLAVLQPIFQMKVLSKEMWVQTEIGTNRTEAEHNLKCFLLKIHIHISGIIL